MSSEVTSGGEGRIPAERKKKKKGGEYVVGGRNNVTASPPEQFKQRPAKPSGRKQPSSLPRRHDESDGSEV